MYAAIAVRAAGRDVNLADRPGQPLPPSWVAVTGFHLVL